jgi:hypothetical protein
MKVRDLLEYIRVAKAANIITDDSNVYIGRDGTTKAFAAWTDDQGSGELKDLIILDREGASRSGSHLPIYEVPTDIKE